MNTTRAPWPLQILTHETVGVGSTPIGEQLRQSSDAQLIIGNRVPTAHHAELQALLNQCGHLKASERPRMDVVLQEVSAIVQTLDIQPKPTPAPPRGDASSDRAALMELYYAMNGPPKRRLLRVTKNTGWKDRQGWGMSRPLAKWHGVAVGGGGRVAVLNLPNNNLSGGRLSTICFWLASSSTTTVSRDSFGATILYLLVLSSCRDNVCWQHRVGGGSSAVARC